MDNRETNPGPAYQAVPCKLADGDADGRMQPLRGGTLSTRAKDLRVATMKLPPLDLAESDSDVDSEEDTAVPRRKQTTKPQLTDNTVTNAAAASAQGADTTDTSLVDVTSPHAVSPRLAQGDEEDVDDTTLTSVSRASQHSHQRDSYPLPRDDDEHARQQAKHPMPDTDQHGKPASFQPLSTLVAVLAGVAAYIVLK